MWFAAGYASGTDSEAVALGSEGEAAIATARFDSDSKLAAQSDSKQAAPGRGFVRLSAGGIFDHRRTWHYRVAAKPGECTDAFVRAFSGGGGLLARAKWDVARTPTGAIATYRGRRGLASIATVLSETASAEQGGAIGAEVKFEIEAERDERTLCGMWLALRTSRLGFTNDGRFFRPYMRAVETELRRVDPATQVVKE